MSGLDGTIKTPFGTVTKKTALLVGGGVVVLGAIVWYRSKQLGLNNSADGTTDAPVNPATGYPYGSPEDAAALASQAAYVSPTVPTGGSSSTSGSSIGFVSNGQWSQAVVSYVVDNGIVSDGGAGMSAALGKFITGAYIAPGSADDSLVQQAIALQGMPPNAGPTGYPPAINRTPPSTTTPTTPSNTNVTTARDLKMTSATASTLLFEWHYTGPNPDFQMAYVDDVPVANLAGNVRHYRIKNLKTKTTHKFSVRGVKGNPGVMGPTVSLSAKTK